MCDTINILVGRLVTSLWGDGWIPVMIINLTASKFKLGRNAKVATVSLCIALEDLEDGIEQTVHQDLGKVSGSCHGSLKAQSFVSGSVASLYSRLRDLGLQELSVDDCEVSPAWKEKVTDLMFSRACENIIRGSHQVSVSSCGDL